MALSTAPGAAVPKPFVRLSFAFATERHAIAALATMREVVSSVSWAPPSSDADLAVVHLVAEHGNRDRVVTLATGLHGFLVDTTARPAGMA